MPPKTVRFDSLLLPPPEGAAQLLSWVAYAEDETRRKAFADSMYRAAVAWRSATNSHWAQGARLLRPSVFDQDDKTFLKFFKDGTKRLGRHLLVSHTFLFPQMRGLQERRKQRLHNLFRLPEMETRRDPSVENLSFAVTKMFGWSEKTASTVKTREWHDVKPVAHLAYGVCGRLLYSTAKATAPKMREDTLYRFCFFPRQVFFDCLAIAEWARRQVPKVANFEFGADQIQFIAPSSKKTPH